jgi:hypothetical protein
LSIDRVVHDSGRAIFAGGRREPFSGHLKRYLLILNLLLELNEPSLPYEICELRLGLSNFSVEFIRGLGLRRVRLKVSASRAHGC